VAPACTAEGGSHAHSGERSCIRPALLPLGNLPSTHTGKQCDNVCLPCVVLLSRYPVFLPASPFSPGGAGERAGERLPRPRALNVFWFMHVSDMHIGK